MRKIPSYELYGEASAARPPWHDAFNFEWIPERSRPNDWNIPAHRHDALLQFLYIRSGQGHVVIESEKTPFNPPCLVILPAQVVHGFAFSPEIDGLVVTAAQRALESIAKSVSSTLVAVLQHPAVIPVCGPAASDETLMPLFHMLENEFRRGAAGYTAAGMSLLMALFVQAARLVDHANVPVAALAARRSQQIRRFRELIAQHFREHRPVEFYAAALDVTPPQLGRICREELGSSPTALINDHLIREAQRDLVYSGMTVKQIAHSLGFEDSAYFSRYFRKQTGATPREFQSSAHRDLALGPS
ncbi:helix-turn-helix domain-containing protein [Paraburkholderia flagellata]|uniref:helix-turn-helix domain-containing protein n=1 Tax=Paraburkholderia flagellata TaxID=2883241 RepID=UPI001F38F76D|nr:helix-turn-helix domain-containing protein [Paraburkholderia flagellata]